MAKVDLVTICINRVVALLLQAVNNVVIRLTMLTMNRSLVHHHKQVVVLQRLLV